MRAFSWRASGRKPDVEALRRLRASTSGLRPDARQNLRPDARQNKTNHAPPTRHRPRPWHAANPLSGPLRRLFQAARRPPRRLLRRLSRRAARRPAPGVSAVCEYAGQNLPVGERCPRCQDESFQFDGVIRLGTYDGARREVILRMKHGRYEALSECVGELWAESAADRLNAVRAVAVVPIPLHWRRRWQRGYNQAEVLARALASRLQLACDARWLRRVRPTPKQTDVAPSARRGNVRGAFRAALRQSGGGRRCSWWMTF